MPSHVAPATLVEGGAMGQFWNAAQKVFGQEMRKWTEGFGGAGSGPEPPAWYYVWPESDPAEAEPSLDVSLSTHLLDYAYWVFLGAFAILLFFSARLALKGFPRLQAQAKPELLAQRDPEEMQLLQGIHLLEAMLCKIQRHLSQKERRRRRRQKDQ